MNRAYLCGPITGTTYRECTDWREYVALHLKAAGIEPLSPMRGKAFLDRDYGVPMKDSYEDTVTANKHTIFTRDKFDCTHSEILIMNLLGADFSSIGSLMELAWAHQAGNFCVLIMENEGNPHEHAFVREACSVRFNNLEEAIEWTCKTFGKK